MALEQGTGRGEQMMRMEKETMMKKRRMTRRTMKRMMRKAGMVSSLGLRTAANEPTLTT